MYPEYKFSKPTLRNLRILEGKYLYDEHGVTSEVCSFDDVRNYLFENNTLCFVNDLTDYRSFPFLTDFVSDKKTKVLCDRMGRALAIRVGGYKNETRWIIQGKSWGVGDEQCEYQEVTPAFLKAMWDMYEYCNVGMAPTPSSLGNLLMKYIHTIEKLKRQTCISLAAEDYLHKYSFGGIIQSPGEGQEFERLAKLDMASAYLSKWTVLPVGSAVPFGYGHCTNFSTYFALCDIEVKRELALGPFPVRKDKGIVYPTIPGRYQTHLWKEQVDDVIRAGASVQPISGIGWQDLCDDAVQWSKHTYWLRKRADGEFIEQCIKRIAVSAIGRHSSPRRHHYLVVESDAAIDEVPVLDKDGNPLRMFVREEYDGRSAYMVHWNKHTVMECNRETYNFALPFAEQGRLVQVYIDSILAVESGRDRDYIKRYSNEALSCEPGTWLLEWRHHVHDISANGFRSDEEDRTPGIARKVVKK
jgi:hypothetical protein